MSSECCSSDDLILTHFTHTDVSSQVRIEIVTGVPLAESVSVDPVGADDWEKTELNAERLEEALLQQVLTSRPPLSS